MSLEEIYNLLPISDTLTTAGQPTSMELVAVAEAGFQVVMNLALNTSDNALMEEAEVVESLGMAYVHIPVLFELPELSDFQIFVANMEEYQGQRIFLHCAANMRVSVFILLYRMVQDQWSYQQALPDMQKIWQPNEIWEQYIDTVLAHYGKTRN